MKLLEPELWTRAVSVSYFLILGLYIFVGAVGYAVYGSVLASASTVLETISAWTSIGPVLPIMAQVAIIVHVAMACPIIINPTFLAVRVAVGVDAWVHHPAHSLAWARAHTYTHTHTHTHTDRVQVDVAVGELLAAHCGPLAGLCRAHYHRTLRTSRFHSSAGKGRGRFPFAVRARLTAERRGGGDAA